MVEEIRSRYDPDVLLKRVPEHRGELFLGFSPWDVDCQGWSRSAKELRPDTPTRSVLRTIWDNPQSTDQRVAIDVMECQSAQEAIRVLLEVLSWNELPQLPEGPPGLGYVAYVHPETAPPATIFARGNLCLSIASFGRAPVETLPWAERIDSRLSDRPSGPPSTIVVRPDKTVARAGEDITLEYSLPWRIGDDGYVKLLAEGGRLERQDGRLIARATRTGTLEVEVLALEPGRQPFGGGVTIRID